MAETQGNQFGTFGGVFTPCTLTILGVIMFLRFGQVVGNAGVMATVAIVVLSKVITSLTALSLSAIATNTKVKGGGAYFVISRSLGLEYGGAIGLVFFLAQAISVAMYVIGFTEAFLDTFPTTPLSMRMIATVVNIVIFACVYIGAGWTIKVQYGILAVLGLSLVSFYVGAVAAFDPQVLAGNLRPDPTSPGFFAMFALFFPAATGIMAGANMSGDLRDPAKSIPLGTLLSIAVTAVVYLSMALLLGAARTSQELIASPLLLKDIAWSSALITGGVFAATLSSALGSMMGAPRILQAFAKDHVFERLRPFARGEGAASEPRRATVLTVIIAQVCILTGDLNVIAPIITMFFMITYGTLNLATFYEAVTKNPSYRPRFRFSHWSISLLGAVGCVVVMFLMEPLWAAVSIAVMIGLHRYIGLREIESRWGDVQSGVEFERARRSLLRLEEQSYHPKNWRPVVLALSGEAWSRVQLAVYGHWLSAGHGVLTLAQVIVGDLDALVGRRGSQLKLLRDFVRREELSAFATVVVAPSLTEGVKSLVQCHGVGGFQANTLLLGWGNDSARAAAFGGMLRAVAKLGRNIVLLRDKDDDESRDSWSAPVGSVDVWWRGKKNGPLMLLLGHMLVQTDAWRTRNLRVLRVISSEGGREEAERHLLELVREARIAATVVIAVGADATANIRRESRAAAVVLLGFEPPGETEEIEFQQSLDQLAGDMRHVLFVTSAGGIELSA